MYRCEDKDVGAMVHGDDFVIEGEEVHMEWLKNELVKVWSIKHVIIGERGGLAKTCRVFNRVLRWHPSQGVTIEADGRHAEIMIRELGVQECRKVTSPTIKEEIEKEEDVIEDIKEKRRNGAKNNEDKEGEDKRPVVEQL